MAIYKRSRTTRVTIIILTLCLHTVLYAVDLGVTLEASPTTGTVNQPITYRATVGNYQRPTTAPVAIYVQKLPEGSELISAFSEMGNVETSDEVVTWTLPNLMEPYILRNSNYGTSSTSGDWVPDRFESILDPPALTGMAADHANGLIYAMNFYGNTLYSFQPSLNVITPVGIMPYTASMRNATILGRSYYSAHVHEFVYTNGPKYINRYDLDTEEHTTISTPLVVPGQALVNDGQYLYMVSNTQFVRYEPSTGNWATLPAPPVSISPLSTLAFYQNSIYSANGHAAPFLRYDITEQTWSELPHLNGASQGPHRSAVDTTNKKLIISSANSYQVFDLEREKWDIKPWSSTEASFGATFIHLDFSYSELVSLESGGSKLFKSVYTRSTINFSHYYHSMSLHPLEYNSAPEIEIVVNPLTSGPTQTIGSVSSDYNETNLSNNLVTLNGFIEPQTAAVRDWQLY